MKVIFSTNELLFLSSVSHALSPPLFFFHFLLLLLLFFLHHNQCTSWPSSQSVILIRLHRFTYSTWRRDYFFENASLLFNFLFLSFDAYLRPSTSAPISVNMRAFSLPLSGCLSVHWTSSTHDDSRVFAALILTNDEGTLRDLLSFVCKRK
jgi:hypothetical protein